MHAMLFLLLAQVAGPQMPPTTQPEMADVNLLQGPMKLEIMAMAERRIRYIVPPPGQPADSQLQFQVRLVGEKLAQAVKHGRFVITKAVDDTGRELVAPDAYSQEDLEQTRPLSQPRLANTGLILVGGVQASTRGAKKLTTLEGYVRVVYAAGENEVTVTDPLGQRGNKVADKALESAGLTVELVPHEKLVGNEKENQTIALKISGPQEQIQGVDFYDAWMKKIFARPAPAKTTDGEDIMIYRIGGGTLDKDSRMVIRVYEGLSDEKIEMKLSDVELP